MVLAKVAAHWVLTGVPLMLISPVLAVQLYLPGEAMGTLILSLLVGTPVLSLLGDRGGRAIVPDGRHVGPGIDVCPHCNRGGH